MGINTLPKRGADELCDATWFNIWKTILSEDVVVRNTIGVGSDAFATLGEATFRWLKAYVQTVILGSSANPISLKAPSMSAPYDLTLPAAPPTASSYIKMDTAGAITPSIADGSNLVTSSSSGNATTTSASYVAVPNMHLTIVVGPGPVLISFQPDGTGSYGLLTGGDFKLTRDGVAIAYWDLLFNQSSGGGDLSVLDTGATPGSHDYDLWFQSTGSVYFQYMTMGAREL